MSRTAPPARRRPFANSNTAARGRLLAENLLRRARMRSPAVQSRPLYERPGYRTLLGRSRQNVRTYIRKQLELPRQEIAEILAANKRAAMWLGAAAGLAFMLLITLVVLLVALVALIPREWLGVLVLALAVGTAFALFVLGVRAKAIVPGFLGGVVLIAIGVAAFLWLPQLVLAALLLTIALAIGAGAMGFGGGTPPSLPGPTPASQSKKETVRWAEQRL